MVGVELPFGRRFVAAEGAVLNQESKLLKAHYFVEVVEVVNDRVETANANTHGTAEEGQTGRELGQKGAAERACIVAEVPTLVEKHSADMGETSARVDMIVEDEIPPTKKVAKEEQKLMALG
jgi:hypothetical protein